MNNIGDRVRKIREELGWSQIELARRSGISKSFLSEIEAGQRNISTDYLSKLAKVLGASLEYLVHGIEAVPPPERAVKVPPELTDAAEEENWPHSKVVTLVRAYETVFARRSARARQPSVDDWKEFAAALDRFAK